MPDLSGHVALITGAGGGIGSAVARRFAADGASVMVTDVAGDAAADVADSIVAAGRRALAARHDVASRSSWQHTIDDCRETLGPVDILVNNAGVVRDHTVLKMTDDDWDTVLAVHLKGCWLGIQHTLGGMRERGWGRVISVSSTAANGAFGQANYAAAKSGIVALTKTVALEAARYGVLANAVAPGAVETQMHAGVPEETKQSWLAGTPLGRFARPEEIAALMAFLASDEASYITGQVITIDGGLSAG